MIDIPDPKPGEIVIVIRHRASTPGRCDVEVTCWPSLPPTIGRRRRMLGALAAAWSLLHNYIRPEAGDRVFSQATGERR